MRETPFGLSSEHLEAGLVVVAVRGELDLSTAAELKRILHQLSAATAGVVVDLAEVEFIDSSGIGALLDLKRRMRLRRTELSVVCPDAEVWSRFMVPTLDRLLDIHPTRDEAIDAVRRHGGVRTSTVTT